MIIKELSEETNKEIFTQWQYIQKYVSLLKRTVKIHNLQNPKFEELFNNISVEMDMIAMTGFDSENMDIEKRFNRICRDILEVTNTML